MPSKPLKDHLSPADRAELEAMEADRLADEGAKAAAAASLPILGSLPDGGMFRLRVASRVLEMPSYLDTDDFEILKARIAEHGVVDPVVCHATEEVDEQTGYPWLSIINGRHRFEAVRRLILETASAIIIPCALSEVSIDDAVVDTLLGRRNTSDPGVRAYLVWPFLAPQVEAAKAAGKASRLAKLRKPKKVSVSETETFLEAAPAEVDGVAELARRYGFSYETLNRARNVHRKFNEVPGSRELFETSLLQGKRSLQDCITGASGKAQKTRTIKPAADMVQASITDWEARFCAARWMAIPPEQRPAVATTVVDAVLKWPADIVSLLRTALKGGTGS